jgi:hypothetical protein
MDINYVFSLRRQTARWRVAVKGTRRVAWPQIAGGLKPFEVTGKTQL